MRHSVSNIALASGRPASDRGGSRGEGPAPLHRSCRCLASSSDPSSSTRLPLRSSPDACSGRRAAGSAPARLPGPNSGPVRPAWSVEMHAIRRWPSRRARGSGCLYASALPRTRGQFRIRYRALKRLGRFGCKSDGHEWASGLVEADHHLSGRAASSHLAAPTPVRVEVFAESRRC